MINNKVRVGFIRLYITWFFKIRVRALVWGCYFWVWDMVF